MCNKCSRNFIFLVRNVLHFVEANINKIKNVIIRTFCYFNMCTKKTMKCFLVYCQCWKKLPNDDVTCYSNRKYV